MTDSTEVVLPETNRDAINNFVQSETFDKLFTDAMEMVQEVANYVDGEGRIASATLPRQIALAYAGETMRLTTSLMQISSWVLVQRAIKEGELTPNEVMDGKYRLSAMELIKGRAMQGAELLPEELLSLIATTRLLFDRIERLDTQLYTVEESLRENDVLRQMSLLDDAFGSSAT